MKVSVAYSGWTNREPRRAPSASSRCTSPSSTSPLTSLTRHAGDRSPWQSVTSPAVQRQQQCQSVGVNESRRTKTTLQLAYLRPVCQLVTELALAAAAAAAGLHDVIDRMERRVDTNRAPCSQSASLSTRPIVQRNNTLPSTIWYSWDNAFLSCTRRLSMHVCPCASGVDPPDEIY